MGGVDIDPGGFDLLCRQAHMHKPAARSEYSNQVVITKDGVTLP